MSIIIYKKEIEDNVAHLVSANSSIAYYQPVTTEFSNIIPDELRNKFIAIASAKAKRNIDQIDLFPIQTVLCTTGWNKNTDIFIREETYAARHSAEDKPLNIGHIQTDIIGHITNNITVD